MSHLWAPLSIDPVTFEVLTWQPVNAKQAAHVVEQGVPLRIADAAELDPARVHYRADLGYITHEEYLAEQQSAPPVTTPDGAHFVSDVPHLQTRKGLGEGKIRLCQGGRGHLAI